MKPLYAVNLYGTLVEIKEVTVIGKRDRVFNEQELVHRKH